MKTTFKSTIIYETDNAKKNAFGDEYIDRKEVIDSLLSKNFDIEVITSEWMMGFNPTIIIKDRRKKDTRKSKT